MRPILHALLLATAAAIVACDTTPTASPDSGAQPSAAPTPPLQGTTCTPGFTPYSKEAGYCSAHHTVCDRADPPSCHGGAFIIRCGESLTVCDAVYTCACPATAPSASSSAR